MVKITLLSLGLLVGFFGFSQTRMTPELLWKLKRIGEVAVSPDGTQVLFSLKNYDLEKNSGSSELYVVSIAGGIPKQVTNRPGNEFNAIWRPDGAKIGFLAFSATKLANP